jgi:hypothetical protein
LGRIITDYLAYIDENKDGLQRISAINLTNIPPMSGANIRGRLRKIYERVSGKGDIGQQLTSHGLAKPKMCQMCDNICQFADFLRQMQEPEIF